MQPVRRVGGGCVVLDELERLNHLTPGLTATELAEALFGLNGYHERVGAGCRMLAQFGRAERRGAGGPGDPYTYHPPPKTGA